MKLLTLKYSNTLMIQIHILNCYSIISLTSLCNIVAARKINKWSVNCLVLHKSALNHPTGQLLQFSLITWLEDAKEIHNMVETSKNLII